MSELITELKYEDDKFIEVGQQDLKSFWKEKKWKDEVGGNERLGNKTLCSIPEVLYHEISRKIGFKLYDLGKGTKEERADKEKILVKVLREEYPNLLVR